MIGVLMAVASTAGTAAGDREALARMALGDESGLADLYDRHGRLVYSLGLRIVRDEGDAQDVAQEVFVQAWRQADRFEASRGNVVAWLVTLTRTRAIDLLRRRRVRPGLADNAAPIELPDGTPRQDVRFEWGERAASIRRAMGDLPPLQRLAIELAFFEGLSHAEIARQLELPLGTVKARVRQGLLKMRERLAEVAS